MYPASANVAQKTSTTNAKVVNAMLVIVLVVATNTGNIAMTAGINLIKVFHHNPYSN